MATFNNTMTLTMTLGHKLVKHKYRLSYNRFYFPLPTSDFHPDLSTPIHFQSARSFRKAVLGVDVPLILIVVK